MLRHFSGHFLLILQEPNFGHLGCPLQLTVIMFHPFHEFGVLRDQ